MENLTEIRGYLSFIHIGFPSRRRMRIIGVACNTCRDC
jgi:hypothetical protein